MNISSNLTSPLATPPQQQPASSCSWCGYKQVIMLTGTLAAITGIVLTALVGAYVLTACFGVAALVTLIGYAFMVKSAKMEQQNKELAYQLEVANSTITSLNSSLQTLTDGTSISSENNRNLATTTIALDQIGNDFKEDATQLSHTVLNLNATNAGLERTENQMQKNLETNSGVLKTIQEELDEGQAIGAQFHHDQESLRIELDENKNTIQNLQTQLEQSKTQNNELIKKLDETEEQCKKIEKTLEELTSNQIKKQGLRQEQDKKVEAMIQTGEALATTITAAAQVFSKKDPLADLLNEVPIHS